MKNKPGSGGKKRLVVTAVIVAVIIAVVAGITLSPIGKHYNILGVNSWSGASKSVSSTDASADPSIQDPHQQLVAKAEAAAQNNYADGQAVYDQQLATITGTDDASKSERAQLYIDKSNLATTLYGKNYDQALEYAQDAENEDPSALTASAIASVYDLMGNNAQALVWYQKQLSRITPEDQKSDPSYYAYLQDTIKQLEANQ